MIFKRGRKRDSESAAEEAGEDVSIDESDEAAEADSETSTEDPPSEDLESDDLAALDELEWRSSGPYDIGEVEDVESTEDSPKIDLGSVIRRVLPDSISALDTDRYGVALAAPNTCVCTTHSAIAVS